MTGESSRERVGFGLGGACVLATLWGPPTEAALLDSKFFDGECCQLPWVPHAALAHLYNLLCDDVGNGIVAVNEAEPA
jgi:hypothetical protein